MTYRVSKTQPALRESKDLANAKTTNHYHLSHYQPALSPLATAVKVAIVGLGLAHSAGQAATIEVNSNFDNGTGCTLRDAIVSMSGGTLEDGCSNTGAAFGIDDVINIRTGVAPVTITLTNGQLEFIDLATPSITINGNGATVDANGQSRVLFVDGLQELTINEMTLTGGSDLYGDGGGLLLNDNKVNIYDSAITNNIADNGGGIWAANVDLRLNNSVVSDNSTDQSYNSGTKGIGGGVGISGGSLSINNSIISDNLADGYYTLSLIHI